MGKLKNTFFIIIESCIRNIDGGLGQKIRYTYYSRRFKECGKNVRIGVGVIIRGCEFIRIKNDVWIDDYCIIIAGYPGEMKSREVKIKENKAFGGKKGEIIMGSNIHIAPFCLIHGFGGVEIGNYVGIGTGSKLYSMSNHYQSFEDKTQITYAGPMVKNKPVVILINPIVIKRNAWLSLNTTFLKGTVGENVFVSPNSIIVKDIADNVIASGSPAIKIRDRYEISEG